jgi:hypothetical protein
VVLTVVVLTLACLVVAALVLVELWARDRGLTLARRRLASVTGVDDVALSVDGRPLVATLLRRPGTVVTLTAHDVPVGDDGRLRDLDATVRDVRLDLRSRCIATGTGTFTATIDERELGGMLTLPSVVARVELRAEGLRVWTVLGVPLDAEVFVGDRTLRVLPDPVQLAPLLRLPGTAPLRRAVAGRGLEVALPALPFDAIVETLSFAAGEVVATGRLAPQRLPLR